MKTRIEVAFDSQALAFYAEVVDALTGATVHTTDNYTDGDKARRAAILWRREAAKSQQAK